MKAFVTRIRALPRNACHVLRLRLDGTASTCER